MRAVGRKWRPSLWFVLGGALAGTLALSLAGLVVFRYLGPAIGFGEAAILVSLVIGLLTAILWFLLWRLLLRPITALAAYASAVRTAPATQVPPPARFGTRELRDMGASVIDMAATLSNREATIRSFTDHVTHELKTPVSSIRAAAELLEDGGGLSTADRRLAARILGACAQMQTQLEALRDVAAAREADHHGQTRLDDHLVPLGAAHPGLSLTVRNGAVALPLSARGLAIVLGHLIGNSAAQGARRVELAAEADGAGPVLHVSDDGPGISEGNAPHVFEPFFTTRRDAGGSGMGLTIVANILQAHGARITLSPSRRGAVFRIDFPPA